MNQQDSRYVWERSNLKGGREVFDTATSKWVDVKKDQSSRFKPSKVVKDFMDYTMIHICNM